MAKKRKFAIYPRTKEIMKDGLKTGKGRLKFRGKSMIITDDASLASEIDNEQGKKGTREVFVVEDERLSRHAQNDGSELHKYTFGASRHYADAWEEFEKRRKDKKRK